MCVTTKKPLTLQNINRKISHLLFLYVWYLPHRCTHFTILSYTAYQKVVTTLQNFQTHIMYLYTEKYRTSYSAFYFI